MAPVWEANHVWLIFVLVVMWTCYPVGVRLDRLDAVDPAVHRGDRDRLPRHVLRAARRARVAAREERDDRRRVRRRLGADAVRARDGRRRDRVGRVPVGNAAGDLWTSWRTGLSLMVGVLAVGDRRLPRRRCTSRPTRCGAATARWSRRSAVRALVAGVVAGALAVAGCSCCAPKRAALYDGLARRGRAAGADRLGARGRRRRWRSCGCARYEQARYSAAARRSPRSSPAGRSRSSRCCCPG